MAQSKSQPGMTGKIPPSHLVIFEHTDTDAIKVIHSARRSLGRLQSRHNALKHAVKYFSPAQKDLQDERVYPRLGIAALHLDPSHVAAFKRHPDVLDVVENRTRHALGKFVRGLTAAEAQTEHAAGGPVDPVRPFGSNDPVLPSGGGNDPVRPFAGGNDPVRPFAGGNDPLRPFGSIEPVRPFSSCNRPGSLPVPPDAMSAYLLGRYDEVANILDHANYSRRGAGNPSIWNSRLIRSRNCTWCLDMIGINAGYTRATGKGIKVAVLDTGLDLKHPDFVHRDNINPRNFLNFIDKNASVQDGYGHGTHCCGIVAGKSDPACQLRYGVAPGTTLLVGKVLDDQGNGKDSDILDGIAWAAEQGARVISLSLGSGRDVNKRFSPAYATVARRLLKPPLNCILVAAAGNMSWRPYYLAPVANPAACPWILSVAALGPNGQIAGCSCAQVDKIGLISLSAPGVRVLSSYPGGEYAELTGTSMAAAHMAGIAALHLETNPDWSSQFLWPMLIRCSLPLGDSADFGYGLGQAP
jgi:subtilisin